MQYPALQIPTHSWLKQLSISYVPGLSTPLSEGVALGLMEHFREEGHSATVQPSPETEVILTTARLGEPLRWREALLFTARRRFRLKHVPTVITIVHALPQQLSEWLAKAEEVLSQAPQMAPPFDGIPQSGARTLYQQGKRGGPILRKILRSGIERGM